MMGSGELVAPQKLSERPGLIVNDEIMAFLHTMVCNGRIAVAVTGYARAIALASRRRKTRRAVEKPDCPRAVPYMGVVP